MNLYDQYDHYYDLTGFDKESLIKYLAFYTSIESERFEWFYDVKNLTATATRMNFGEGSVVWVMWTFRDNIHIIIFTNHVEEKLGYNYSNTTNKNKFAKWLKPLFN